MTSEALLQKIKEWSDYLTKVTTDLPTVDIPLLELRTRMAALKLDLANLQSLQTEQEREAWCVDLTEDAEGEVGTIEVPGEPQRVLIAPGGQGGLGKLMARALMSPEQAFYNAAILPGWQRFKPTYRVGTAIAVNKTANTMAVTLDDVTSTAQDLNVMKGPLALQNVPVQYMSCNAKAFEDGDRVVVEFVGMTWDNPRVIGFVQNPRRCRIPQYLYAGVSIAFVGAGPIGTVGDIHSQVLSCGGSGMRTTGGTRSLRSRTMRSVGRWTKPEIVWGTLTGVPDTAEIRAEVLATKYLNDSNTDLFDLAPGIETLVAESGPAFGYPANGGSVKLIRQQGMKSADGVSFVPMAYTPDVTLPDRCPGDPGTVVNYTAGLVDVGTAGLLTVEGYTTTKTAEPVSGVDTATGATMDDLDAYLRTLFDDVPEGFTVTDVNTGEVIEYEFDGYGNRGQEVMDDPIDEEPYFQFTPVARYRPKE
jgi:hypothetical protein